MADAVDPNGGGADKADSAPNPPTDPNKFPIWCMTQAMGETMAESFLEDPEWVDAMNKAEMTEEDFIAFWQGMMDQLYKEVGKSADWLKELNEEDEEKNAVTKAMAIM